MKSKKKVWSKKVSPKDYPDFYEKKVSPVTWDDLGNRFHTTAFRQFHIDKNGYMDRYKEEIKLFTETYDLGDILWLHFTFIFAKNFKEVVQYIKKKNLYVFDIWGYVPGRLGLGFPEYKSTVTPAGDAHRYLLETLGSKFLGWDNGEQDGRFIVMYSSMVSPAPQTRREAYEAFSKFFHHIGDDMSNYMVVLLGMYFAHYMAHFGNHRLLGAETAQILPSVPPWYAYIRGAGKQYGILWFGNISVFNRWGWKQYGKQNKDNSTLPRAGGPDRGTSLELLKRLWYVEYMYGCCMNGYEQAQILGINSQDYLDILEGRKKEEDIDKFHEKPPLSPIGELQIDCTKWCKRYPDVGVQHTPVALLMDFYSGWTPARCAYTQGTEGGFRVWGNMPYEKGDHQIDAFFRFVYPTYEDSGYFKDERGFLTPTPVGDIFDVLLSNVSAEILHQYETVVLLGEIMLQGKLLRRIQSFVSSGGKLLIASSQLSEQAKSMFNFKSSGVMKEAGVSMCGNKVFKEKLFMYEEAEITGSTVLAATDKDAPLIFRKEYGKGEIIILTPEFGLNKEENPDPVPKITKRSTDFPARYSLLECVKDFMREYFIDMNLVKVDGAPIQYITNVTEDPEILYITLSNNEARPWKGCVQVKGLQDIEIEDLFNGKKLSSSDGSFKPNIAPSDVGIYRIKTRNQIIIAKPPLAATKPKSCLAVWSRANAAASIQQNIEIIGRSSFKSIEICATQVLGMNDLELSLLSEECSASNLDVCALTLVHAQTPYVDFNNVSAAYPDALKRNRNLLAKSLDVAVKLQCKRIIMSGGFKYPTLSDEEGFRITANIVSEFAKEAKDSGVMNYTNYQIFV